MSATTARRLVNRFLEGINLRVETLTAERRETARLTKLDEAGHFGRPCFPIPPSFMSMECDGILQNVLSYQSRFRDFENQSTNVVNYTFSNGYFTSPDAEVLYAVLREFQPRIIIEVGSGNSTRVARQAILDGGLPSRLISVDPQPRIDITGLADEVYRQPVELGGAELFGDLRAGDVLFIDSSHEVKAQNDVVFLYLHLIPSLPNGVLIHIHDIFLPYDYPREWILKNRWPWNEQYLVQSLLMFGDSFDVLWAGYYLQRTLPDFAEHFPHLGSKFGTSLWLRKANRVSV